MLDYLWLSLGVLCAAIGGELFVRGAVGLAQSLRIPTGIIGVTIAAFATSSPELAVSISAASSGTPQIALGDALGSNVINISLILALALLISGLQTSFSQIKRDYLVAFLTPLIIAVLAFDGQLSRIDSLILLASFAGWLVLVVREARQHRHMSVAPPTHAQGWLELLVGPAGLIFLVAAGYLIVTGAKGIAATWGIDEFVIGATVVAVATGTPELATTLISKLRGHNELGLGNILGSNIFNGLFIVAVAAFISPITITWIEVAFGLSFGVITTLVIFPFGRGWLGRPQAILLLLIYAIYNMVILQQ